MLSVVIADDEHAIINLIKNLIECPYAKIIGEAQDGLEAYNIICELHPNLVITDIYMPGMDGISLIEKVREKYDDINFVIISGYRNFKDAYRALKFGVQEYLLKPIKKKELNDLLYKLAEKKDQDIELKKHIETIETSLKETNRKIRKEMLGKAFADPVAFDLKSGLAAESNAQFQCTDCTFCTAALKFDFNEVSRDGFEQITLIMENICEKTLGVLRDTVREAEYVIINTTACYLLKYRAENFALKNWKDILLPILKHEACKYDFLKIYLAIGTEEKSLDGFERSWSKAKKAIACRINSDSRLVIEYDQLSKKEKESVQPSLQESEMAWVVQCVETGNTDRTEILIQEMIDAYRRMPAWDDSQLYALAASAITLSEKLISRIPMLGQTVAWDTKRHLMNIDNSSSVEELQTYLKSCIKENIAACISAKSNEESRPIRLAKQYVDENYDKQIKLEDAAGVVDFNPAYLSRLFKTQTGISFSDYIINVRIEKAKELLRDSLYNVNEIARLVGYNDIRYFSKLFIKVVGIKPTQYKKFYS